MLAASLARKLLIYPSNLGRIGRLVTSGGLFLWRRTANARQKRRYAPNARHPFAWRAFSFLARNFGAHSNICSTLHLYWVFWMHGTDKINY